MKTFSANGAREFVYFAKPLRLPSKRVPRDRRGLDTRTYATIFHKNLLFMCGHVNILLT
jgi:hypothetical protein